MEDKQSLGIAIIAIILFILPLIPSQETMYKMLIASYITPNNIEQTSEFVGDKLDSMVDKITDSAIKIKKAGE